MAYIARRARLVSSRNDECQVTERHPLSRVLDFSAHRFDIDQNLPAFVNCSNVQVIVVNSLHEFHYWNISSPFSTTTTANSSNNN